MNKRIRIQKKKVPIKCKNCAHKILFTINVFMFRMRIAAHWRECNNKSDERNGEKKNEEIFRWNFLSLIISKSTSQNERVRVTIVWCAPRSAMKSTNSRGTYELLIQTQMIQFGQFVGAFRIPYGPKMIERIERNAYTVPYRSSQRGVWFVRPELDKHCTFAFAMSKI